MRDSRYVPIRVEPISDVRFARPTARMEEVVRFYEAGLGLPRIGSFEDHDGISGVMIGLPATGTHLELTEHPEPLPTAPPSADHLLVLYLPDASAVASAAGRLAALGYEAVPAANPYWEAQGAVTVPDPDGWRVVLMPRPFGA